MHIFHLLGEQEDEVSVRHCYQAVLGEGNMRKSVKKLINFI